MCGNINDRTLCQRRAVPTLTMLGLFLLITAACQQMGGISGRHPVDTPSRESQVHHYRYFPESAVYMDTEQKLFYYKKGEKWISTTILPANIQMDWKSYVVIDLNTDKPYLLHTETARKYPRKPARMPNQ
jgi:hypothetical protein